MHPVEDCLDVHHLWWLALSLLRPVALLRANIGRSLLNVRASSP